MYLTLPPTAEWYMDIDVDNLMHDVRLKKSLFLSPPSPHTHTQSNLSSIVVGNKSLLPVTSTSHTPFSVIYHQLHLRHVLFYPNIIKILFLFASLPLIIKFLLNLIPLVFL
jgi:hypothetical protein